MPYERNARRAAPSTIFLVLTENRGQVFSSFFSSFVLLHLRRIGQWINLLQETIYAWLRSVINTQDTHRQQPSFHTKCFECVRWKHNEPWRYKIERKGRRHIHKHSTRIKRLFVCVVLCVFFQTGFLSHLLFHPRRRFLSFSYVERANALPVCLCVTLPRSSRLSVGRLAIDHNLKGGEEKGGRHKKRSKRRRAKQVFCCSSFGRFLFPQRLFPLLILKCCVSSTCVSVDFVRSLFFALSLCLTIWCRPWFVRLFVSFVNVSEWNQLTWNVASPRCVISFPRADSKTENQCPPSKHPKRNVVNTLFPFVPWTVNVTRASGRRIL